MDEANQREATEGEIAAALDGAEVLICLSEVEGGIGLQIIPRDEAPNGDSLAVIVASWLDSNLATITKAAVQAKIASEQPQADIKTDGGDLRIIASRPVRSVTTVGGQIAKKDAAEILGPDGKPLQ